MEVMDVVLVQPFERLIAKRFGEVVKRLHVEKGEHPLVEHQFVGKANLLLPICTASGAASFQWCPRCGISFFPFSCRSPMSDKNCCRSL